MEKSLPSTVYIDGKKQAPKRPTRVLLVKGAALHFRIAMRSRLDALSRMRYPELNDLGISSQVDALINESNACIAMVLELKNGITKLSKDQVAGLRISHDRLKDSVNSHHHRISKIDPRTLDELNLLLGECSFFIDHYRDICNAIWNGQSLPNRPVDRDLKQKFLHAVIDFQDKNCTEKFPAHRDICEAIGISPLRFSARRYRDWKAQWINNTFHLLRQPKKVKTVAISRPNTGL
jgi:hypothetical protein